MIQRLARIACMIAVLALTGCGGHRATRAGSGTVHRSGGTWHGGGGYAGAATRSGADGDAFRDDISRSQSSRYRDSDDSVPPPIDVSTLVEPVPKVEPRALYGNKSPYSVLGQTYTVLPQARGYDERGIASFYGTKFHRYKTSSLEDYDMYKFSAAHKTLPLPSYARVTNLENGKSVVVRINDRGPFKDNRIIDLSYAAAVKIGVYPRGTGLVEVRALDPAHPGDAPPPAAIVAGQTRPSTAPVPAAALARRAPAAAASTARAELRAGPTVPVVGPRAAIFLQVGAFADAGNAERTAQRLRQANFAAVRVIRVEAGGRAVNRVRVGPIDDVERADEITAKIEDMGLPRPQVAVD